MIPIVFCASLVPCPRLYDAAERSCRRRNRPSTRLGRKPTEDPERRDHQAEPQHEPEHGREHDEDQDLGEPGQEQRAEAGLGDGGAAIAADQGVRRARWGSRSTT